MKERRKEAGVRTEEKETKSLRRKRNKKKKKTSVCWWDTAFRPLLAREADDGQRIFSSCCLAEREAKVECLTPEKAAESKTDRSRTRGRRAREKAVVHLTSLLGEQRKEKKKQEKGS